MNPESVAEKSVFVNESILQKATKVAEVTKVSKVVKVRDSLPLKPV